MKITKNITKWEVYDEARCPSVNSLRCGKTCMSTGTLSVERRDEFQVGKKDAAASSMRGIFVQGIKFGAETCGAKR